MSDLTKRLYKIAKDRAFRHHHVNMYAPGDKTTHRDFIEWEAADEIERLRKRNALLEDVAVAADRYAVSPYCKPVQTALDKLREVDDDTD